MKRAAGFTLLEVLVTLTVLAVGTALTLSLISGALGNIRRVRIGTRAIEHAQTVMELALLDDSIKGATTLTGDFEDGTRWAVVISEAEIPLGATVLTGVQATQLPFKVLSYVADITEPNSATPSFQLQTMKLINVSQQALPGQVP